MKDFLDFLKYLLFFNAILVGVVFLIGFPIYISQHYGVVYSLSSMYVCWPLVIAMIRTE